MPLIETKGTTVKPTAIGSANTYSSGQAIGSAAMVLTGAVSERNTGVLMSVSVNDAANQSSAIDLFFFNQQPSNPTDHTTYAPSGGDQAMLLGVVKIPAANYSALSANALATVSGIGLSLASLTGDKTGTIYCVAVCRGAPTYTSGCLQFTFGVLQD